MMESGVLKILAFQYECFAEITEETYLKFLENFSNLNSAVKVNMHNKHHNIVCKKGAGHAD
jgi:hypothetical protein